MSKLLMGGVTPLLVAALIAAACSTTTTTGGAAPTTGSPSRALEATTPPPQSTGPPTTVPPTTPPTTQPPAKTFTTFGDDIYKVPSDLKPGTYRTREGSAGCYWARLKGFSGGLNDILANANTDDPTVVTIKSTDKGFESDACGEWTSDLSQITSSKTKFGNGIFIVGADIKPGTYKTSGGDGCYWARLKGFTGDLGDVLANDLPSHSAIVTIKSTDKGFESTGCADWS